jgi:acetolactate synthase-1/2/3 large subunit
MTTTAAVTASALAEAGIDRVFGLPGGEVLGLIDELRRVGIDFVLMRHEANAGIAAAVYGKLRGRPGVVITTLGPGAANLMLPLSNAYLDQEPLLAITAQLADDSPASHTHQLLPLHDVYRPICRYVGKLTSESAAETVTRALEACMYRPFGASYLTLSAREAAKPLNTNAAGAIGANDRPTDPPRTGARGRAEGLANVLRAAQRPLVLIGLGTDVVNAPLIRQWIDQWHLPVAVTPKMKGIVDETADNFVGVIGGMAADDLMVEALKSADLLIGLGLDAVEIDKTWHAELPIHWLLDAPCVGGIIPNKTPMVDHGPLVDALLKHPAPYTWRTPFKQFQDQRRALLTGESESSHTMWPGDIVRALADVMPPEGIVTTDVGSHKYLFGQFWPSRQPGTFWMSNGLSAMGYGLSAAIGAKLARREVPVLAVLGDGGFAMNSQELETAQRVNAPLITVVLEDHSYSLIKLAQEKRNLESYRMDFGPIDTVKIAEACGVEGLRTSNPDELASATKRAIKRQRSLVVGIPVDYRDYRRLF